MIPDGTRVPEPVHVKQVRPDDLAPSTLSLVVFGPGQGEAMVVVLPDGRVGVVDGCREPTSLETGHGDPVREFLLALEERSRARGDPFRLGFVCLTHPHDDHYGGLGRLLAAYKGRIDAVWSVAKVGDRYARALKDYVEATRAGRDTLPDDAEVRGLERVLSEFVEAYNQYGAKVRHLSEGKRLLSETIDAHSLYIEACGPADIDVENAQMALVEGLHALATNGTHKTRFDPNATSGVLLLRWGQAGILLGGDLLCAQGRYHGWSRLFTSIEPPVQVIKVAHHASAEAHHEELWTRLGAKLALVTPFKEAKISMPPRPEQISRLAKDAVVAISAVPDWPEASGNPRAVYPKKAGPAPSVRVISSARNPALSLKAKPGERDTHNAIAVSLNATGQVVRFVLAGKANVYEPGTPAVGLPRE